MRLLKLDNRVETEAPRPSSVGATPGVVSRGDARSPWSWAQDELQEDVLALEREVERRQLALVQLEQNLRATGVEAEAARDPRQFRSSLLASRLRPGAIAGPVGFLLGLWLGLGVVFAVASFF